MTGGRRFAVALSFDGAHREYVREVARALEAALGRPRVLFDEYIDWSTTRPDGDLYLASLYRTEAELVVVFLCSRYAGNMWACEEWRHIRRLIEAGEGWRIMFVELEPPGDLSAIGILPGDFALQFRGRPAAEIAEKILARHAEPAEVRPTARPQPPRPRPVDPARGGGWPALIAAHGCAIAHDAPTSAMSLTAALLRVAAADPRQTRADHLGPRHVAALTRLEKAVTRTMTTATARGMIEYLPPAVTNALLKDLDACGATRGLGAGAPALRVAQVIDAKVGATFMSSFRGVRELVPGDPVPVVPPPIELVPELAEEVEGQPPSSFVWLDRVRHLRLAPDEVAGIRVRLVWQDGWLEPVDASTRFAAIVTNRDIDGDFVWHEYELDDAHWFYGVRPRDPAAQRALVGRGVDAARANKASVVVLPELSVPSDLIDDLAASGALEGLSLVVAGSTHIDAGERAPGHNVARVFAHGVEIHAHRKFGLSSYTAAGGATYREHLERPIDCGFDVLIGTGCAVVVLIDEDVHSAELSALVEALAPTLVLVPAMSDRVTHLRRLAARLASEPMGFSLVACIGSEAGAILGTPGRAEPHAPVIQVPAVVLFTPQGSCETVDLTAKD